MHNRWILLALLLWCVVPAAQAGELMVKRIATHGEPNPAAGEKPGGIDRIDWITEDLLLVQGSGRDGKGFVRCLRAADGEVVWDRRFELPLPAVSLSADRAVLVVNVDAPHVLGDFEDPGDVGRKPPRESPVVAELCNAKTGEVVRKIRRDEVYGPTHRDANYSLDCGVIAGPTGNEVLVTFGPSLRDELRFKREDKDDAGPPITPKLSYGYRAYLIDLKQERITARFKMDPYINDMHLSADGRFLGYVSAELFSVYDKKRQRDHMIFGKHVTEPTGWSIEIDTPFFSNIRVNEQVAVVTKDASFGPADSKLIVVDMVKGKILANRGVPGGHVELAVDPTQQRIAITGSSCDLSIYDYQGRPLAQLDDASKERNYSVSFSPSGDRLAVGGVLGVVEVYSLAE